MSDRMNGLLLFAHGARDPAWALPFEAVARHCAQQRPDRPLSLAYLEFMTPDLLDAGRSLAAQGCVVVDVVPLFLGTGGHVRKDIPRLLEQLTERHPQVRWCLHPTIGESSQVVEAMARVALSNEGSA